MFLQCLKFLSFGWGFSCLFGFAFIFFDILGGDSDCGIRWVQPTSCFWNFWEVRTQLSIPGLHVLLSLRGWYWAPDFILWPSEVVNSPCWKYQSVPRWLATTLFRVVSSKALYQVVAAGSMLVNSCQWQWQHSRLYTCWLWWGADQLGLPASMWVLEVVAALIF